MQTRGVCRPSVKADPLPSTAATTLQVLEHVLPSALCNLVWGITWRMALERYICYLNYALIGLTQLVEKVRGPCHCVDPGEGLSTQMPDGFCAVIASPAGARVEVAEHRLEGWMWLYAARTYP